MNAHHNILMEKLRYVGLYSTGKSFLNFLSLRLQQIRSDVDNCTTFPKVDAETFVLISTKAIAINSLPTSINPSKPLHHCPAATVDKWRRASKILAVFHCNYSNIEKGHEE